MSNSIGSYAREQIINNPQASNQEILEKVKEQFPQAKTSIACIAWYKSDMKKKGIKSLPAQSAPRTHELVAEEIVATKLKLQCLQEEYDELLEQDRANLIEQLAELANKLGVELPAIPEQQQQEESESNK